MSTDVPVGINPGMRELVGGSVDAAFTSLGQMFAEIGARTEPYFPLAALEAVWLQALVVFALVVACFGYRRNLVRLGTLLRRTGSEAATPGISWPSGQQEISGAGSSVREIGLNLTGTVIVCYLAVSACVGVVNLYAWMFLAIGG